MEAVKWEIKPFKKLSLIEFHDVIALRIAVFIVEQNCPYQELDGKDFKAIHVIGKDNKGKIIATARILPKGITYDEVAIGRVVTAQSIRHLKKGHKLMNVCMTYIKDNYPNENVKLSAQSHLVNYYGAHGFTETGKYYLEDDIPHSEMLFEAKLIGK